MRLHDKWDKKIEHTKYIEQNLNLLLCFFVIALCLFGGYILYDMWKSAQVSANPNFRTHNFADLLKSNPDTVAWLQMKGTKIDYPVLQAKDDYYYLDKDFDKHDSTTGSLFLCYRNQKNFSDTYNVIHGHNMYGDVMFGGLRHYKKKKFFKKYKTGMLFTPKGNYKLTVMGVASCDAYSPLCEANANPNDIQSKCKFYRKSVARREGKVLTLATCSESGHTNERTLVFCKIEQETGKGDFY